MILRIFGFLIVFSCLTLVYLFEGQSGAQGHFRLLHWPAIVLTAIGPIGLLFISSDWRTVLATLKLITQQSPTALELKTQRDAEVLQQIGQDFYTSGSHSLQAHKEQAASPILARVIDRLSIRIPVADVRNMVEKESERMESRLQRSVQLLAMGVRLAPSIGMLGTILGMVQLLSHLSDPSQIGSHMGLALLTTFYGLFFSLVIWTPAHHHMECLLDAEWRSYEQMLHWIDLLEKRKPAEYFAEIVRGPTPGNK